MSITTQNLVDAGLDAQVLDLVCNSKDAGGNQILSTTTRKGDPVLTIEGMLQLISLGGPPDKYEATTDNMTLEINKYYRFLPNHDLNFPKLSCCRKLTKRC